MDRAWSFSTRTLGAKTASPRGEGGPRRSSKTYGRRSKAASSSRQAFSASLWSDGPGEAGSRSGSKARKSLSPSPLDPSPSRSAALGGKGKENGAPNGFFEKLDFHVQRSASHGSQASDTVRKTAKKTPKEYEAILARRPEDDLRHLLQALEQKAQRNVAGFGHGCLVEPPPRDWGRARRQGFLKLLEDLGFTPQNRGGDKLLYRMPTGEAAALGRQLQAIVQPPRDRVSENLTMIDEASDTTSILDTSAPLPAALASSSFSSATPMSLGMRPSPTRWTPAADASASKPKVVSELRLDLGELTLSSGNRRAPRVRLSSGSTSGSAMQLSFAAVQTPCAHRGPQESRRHLRPDAIGSVPRRTPRATFITPQAVKVAAGTADWGVSHPARNSAIAALKRRFMSQEASPAVGDCLGPLVQSPPIIKAAPIFPLAAAASGASDSDATVCFSPGVVSEGGGPSEGRCGMPLHKRSFSSDASFSASADGFMIQAPRRGSHSFCLHRTGAYLEREEETLQRASSDGGAFGIRRGRGGPPGLPPAPASSWSPLCNWYNPGRLSVDSEDGGPPDPTAHRRKRPSITEDQPPLHSRARAAKSFAKLRRQSVLFQERFRPRALSLAPALAAPGIGGREDEDAVGRLERVVPWPAWAASHHGGSHLGSGAFKDVYRVHAAEHEDAVAVSILDVGRITDLGAEDVVEREIQIGRRLARLARDLRLPFYIDVHDAYRCHCRPLSEVWVGAFPSLPGSENVQHGVFQYIETEFCDLGDLEEVIRARPGGRLSGDEVLSFAFQMLGAVAVAQQRLGLRHYDLKLLNFLGQSRPAPVEVTAPVDVGGSQVEFRRSCGTLVKLADFGTSDMRPDTLGEPVGIEHFTTLENTPIEMLTLGSEVCQGFACDSFPLGLSLLHLLTGHAPYEELLGTVRCPLPLVDELKSLWEVDAGAFNPIFSVIASDFDEEHVGGHVLYHTLYRFLVLLGMPSKQEVEAEREYAESEVWRVLLRNLADDGKRKTRQKQQVLRAFQKDHADFSIWNGASECMSTARATMAELPGMEAALRTLLDVFPSSRGLAADALQLLCKGDCQATL